MTSLGNETPSNASCKVAKYYEKRGMLPASDSGCVVCETRSRRLGPRQTCTALY